MRRVGRALNAAAKKPREASVAAASYSSNKTSYTAARNNSKDFNLHAVSLSALDRKRPPHPAKKKGGLTFDDVLDNLDRTLSQREARAVRKEKRLKFKENFEEYAASGAVNTSSGCYLDENWWWDWSHDCVVKVGDLGFDLHPEDVRVQVLHELAAAGLVPPHLNIYHASRRRLAAKTPNALNASLVFQGYRVRAPYTLDSTVRGCVHVAFRDPEEAECGARVLSGLVFGNDNEAKVFHRRRFIPGERVRPAIKVTPDLLAPRAHCGTRLVKISNLPLGLSENEIQGISQGLDARYFDVQRDVSGKFSGTILVVFHDADEAQAAIHALNGMSWFDDDLVIEACFLDSRVRDSARTDLARRPKLPAADGTVDVLDEFSFKQSFFRDVAKSFVATGRELSREFVHALLPQGAIFREASFSGAARISAIALDVVDSDMIETATPNALPTDLQLASATSPRPPIDGEWDIFAELEAAAAEVDADMLPVRRLAVRAAMGPTKRNGGLRSSIYADHFETLLAGLLRAGDVGFGCNVNRFHFNDRGESFLHDLGSKSARYMRRSARYIEARPDGGKRTKRCRGRGRRDNQDPIVQAADALVAQMATAKSPPKLFHWSDQYAFPEGVVTLPLENPSGAEELVAVIDWRASEMIVRSRTGQQRYVLPDDQLNKLKQLTWPASPSKVQVDRRM